MTPTNEVQKLRSMRATSTPDFDHVSNLISTSFVITSLFLTYFASLSVCTVVHNGLTFSCRWQHFCNAYMEGDFRHMHKPSFVFWKDFADQNLCMDMYKLETCPVNSRL